METAGRGEYIYEYYMYLQCVVWIGGKIYFFSVFMLRKKSKHSTQRVLRFCEKKPDPPIYTRTHMLSE